MVCFINLKMFRSNISLGLFALILLSSIHQIQGTISNCATYSNSGSLCSGCNPGYTVSGGGATCTKIDCSAMTSCILCSSTSVCLSCDFGYQVNGGSTGCTQISCNDGHCNLCQSSAANQCYSCLTNYYVNSYAC